MNSEQKFKYYKSIHSSLSSLSNLELNFPAVQKVGEHPLEQVYMFDLFEKLKKWDDFNKYKFLIIGSHNQWSYDITDNTIVFYLSNEDHKVPSELLKAKAVFTPYAPLKKRPVNCYPIPLGYNGITVEHEMIEVHKRPFDVFFSGNIHRRRISFLFAVGLFRVLNKIFYSSNNKIKNRIRLSRGFLKGYSPDVYTDYLRNSKIALVPQGYLSNNTFRFYEACKAGNVIITYQLCNYEFFESFPGVQIKTWFQIPFILRNLLTNKNLEKMQKETLDYYEKNCSPEATALDVINRIKA